MNGDEINRSFTNIYIEGGARLTFTKCNSADKAGEDVCLTNFTIGIAKLNDAGAVL
jgi:hypothetical protein